MGLTKEELAEQFAIKIADMMATESDEQVEGIEDLSGSEVFSALLLGAFSIYRMSTSHDADLIEFSHVLNRLAINLAVEHLKGGGTDAPVQ